MTDKSGPNYGSTSPAEDPNANSAFISDKSLDDAKWKQLQPISSLDGDCKQPLLVPGKLASDGTVTGFLPLPDSANGDSIQPLLLVTEKQAFGDKLVRRGFMRKVFALVLVQLLLAIGLVSLFTFEKTLQNYVQLHSWIYWASYITFFVVLFSISIFDSFRRKAPGNYIALLLITLSLGYMTGMIASYYETQIVLMSLGISAIVIACIIIFSFQSRIDCTKNIGIIASLSLVLFFFGVFALIIGVGYHQDVTWIIYSGLAALLLMAYLVVDVQLLMGKRLFALGPKDYVYAASQIFVDIFNKRIVCTR